MLSTPAGGGEEVRWLLLAVHVDLGLKKGGGGKGGVLARAQLGFTPELIHTGMSITFLVSFSSYTVPLFQPPLLSNALAPG